MGLSDQQKKLIDNFQWEDDAGDNSGNEHEYAMVHGEIAQCVDAVISDVLLHLSIEHYASDNTFSISIPVLVHPLLEDRFDDKYTYESRVAMFDLIRAVFKFKFNDVAHQISKKINELFNDMSGGHVAQDMLLHDVDDGITAEIFFIRRSPLAN